MLIKQKPKTQNQQNAWRRMDGRVIDVGGEEVEDDDDDGEDEEEVEMKNKREKRLRLNESHWTK